MDDYTRRWRELYELGAQQHHVVGAAQARNLGIPPTVLRDHRDREGWSLHRFGPLKTPGAPASFEQDAAAALLVVGPPALLTGTTVLYLDNLLAQQPSHVTVLVESSRSPLTRRGLTVRRCRQFDLAVPRRCAGMPAVHLEWAIIDGAKELGASRTGRAIATASRLRLSSVDDVEHTLELRRNVPGVGVVREAIAELRGELTHSRPEQIGRAALHRLGVQMHPEPFLVTARGRKVAEIDIARPDLLYGAEIDGPHHLLPEQREHDAARDRALVDLGWRIDRFSDVEVLADPDTFARTVAATIRQRERAQGQAR